MGKSKSPPARYNRFMMFLATIVSRLFEPAILMAIIFLMGGLRLGVSFVEGLGWLAVVLVPTLSYRFWVKAKEHLDWDIKDRSRRIKPLIKLLIFFGSATVVVSIIEPRLVSLFLFFFLWAVGFFVITAFWTKISGHAAGSALATGLFVSWFGWTWWPVLLIVPLVSWARVVTKNHSVSQVIAGALYSWGLVALL